MSSKQVLATLTKLLVESGDLGAKYAEYGLRLEDPLARADYYVDTLLMLRARAQRALKFKGGEEPVGIRQFIESPEYLNKGGDRDADGKITQPIIFSTLMGDLEELNNGLYTEAVVTGSIGTGKTTIALYTQAYQLYLLSRLENPHREFGLDPSSEIEIVFQSVSAALAKSVDFERFRALIESAPYFHNHFPFDPDLKTVLNFPNRIVVKPVSGLHTGALGQNVIGGIIDEMNLMAIVEESKAVVGGGMYDQAVENYNALARRRESRFMANGFLPGMLCLVSSKQYQGQFTDRKIQEAKTNPKIFVFDKKLWEVKPDKYSKKMFRVFIGDQQRRPRILMDDEVVSEDDRHLLLEVPVDFRTAFETDIFNALRDIGGTSTTVIHPFLPNFEAVHATFGRCKSILSLQSADLVEQRPSLYVKRIQRPDEPRFAHIDLAITNDSAGLAIGWVPGFKDVKRNDSTVETLPMIQFDVLLEIRPPRGGEIDFSCIRRIIYGMRNQGLHIKWVTLDSFQSKDTMQNLAKKGILSGLQSMDTSPDAYVVLKSALYDGRVVAPEHEKAERELLHLEWDAKKKKVDHPARIGQFVGSKDVADAMAGVAFGLTMRREIWFRHGKIAVAPKWLSRKSAEAEKRQQQVSQASGDLSVDESVK